MDTRELRKLFMQLSPEEKVAQTVQLNGSLVVENDVMNTGPMQDLGLPEELNFYEVGSIYNLNDFAKLKRLQEEETLKNSKHKNPLTIHVRCDLWISDDLSDSFSTSWII